PLPQLKEFRQSVIARSEKKYLTDLMEQTAWDIEQACDVSGLKRARLYQLLKTYGISK
ncbi:MAG: sigma-54-dependent Fis family transcriptional regulator, partial [Desulfobacteraceae bacterium]